ncbi:MAG: response regulator [Ilumatobacteraceae bacterium]
MADGRPTRVFVVDDHAVFVQGLLRLLTEFDDLVSCGVATTATAALEQIGGARPDVVLLDNRLPDLTGVELAARLTAEQPTARLVMLAGHVDDDLLIDVKLAGASAVLSKECSIEEIVAEIRGAAAPAGSAPLRGRGGRTPFALTARELEVLHAIGRGLTAAAMSAELHLSTHTVRNYTQRVLDKLGAHSKAEAVAIAGRYGLLTTARRTA